MTPIYDRIPVPANEIIDFILADKALNQSDVDLSLRFSTSASDHAHRFARQV